MSPVNGCLGLFSGEGILNGQPSIDDLAALQIFLQETDRKFQETDRQIRELGKQIGGLGNKFGSFTEGLALPSMQKILQ